MSRPRSIARQTADGDELAALLAARMAAARRMDNPDLSGTEFAAVCREWRLLGERIAAAGGVAHEKSLADELAERRRARSAG